MGYEPKLSKTHRFKIRPSSACGLNRVNLRTCAGTGEAAHSLLRCEKNRDARNSDMMSKSLAILVIDENRIRAAIIEAGLREAGHADVTVVHDVTGIARRIAEINPDVIVIDLENPNRDMLESMFQLSRAVKRPIAMFVDRSDHAAIEAAVDAGVSAYVVDGLKQGRVKPILQMAISRFNAFSRMARELEEARNELENRKVVERAKGILMKSRGFSEETAYALMRKTAMNQNRKIAEIAQSLVTAAGLLGSGEES
jgi:two-component system, response regulator / RNA-binding antiterminator